jgi:hypothetical protein
MYISSILVNLNALIHIQEIRRLYLTPKSFCVPVNGVFASLLVGLRPLVVHLSILKLLRI